MNGNSMARVNYVEFACGRRGSGKSSLLARRASAFPRRIVLDFADEFQGAYAGAFECVGFPETLDALEEAVKLDRWTLVCSLLPAEVVKLAALLSPPGRPRNGVSYLAGGVLLECGEVELIAPSSSAMRPEIANLVHRGRHSLTSMLWATRRPRDVSRLVTSQLDVISIFRQQEPSDIDYLASLVGSEIAAHVAALGEWEHVQVLPSYGRMAVMDKDGNEKTLIAGE
jgi:hypothetical protein